MKTRSNPTNGLRRSTALTNTEHVSWEDGKGYSYHGDGEYTTADMWECKKVPLQKVFDTDGRLIQLYTVSE